MMSVPPDNLRRDTAPSDVLVPASLLAHGLGTPLNVLQGYTQLLATGAFGPLGLDAEAALAEMRAAAGCLGQTLELLLAAPAPDRPDLDGPDRDLLPLLAAAWREHGCSLAAGAHLCLEGSAWSGWQMLFKTVLAAVFVRGVETVVVGAVDGGLAFAPMPPMRGSGDDALATFLAMARARELDGTLETLDAGGLVLRGVALRRVRGHLHLYGEKDGKDRG